jgi:hypothetical protein
MGDYYGHYLMAMEWVRRTHEEADRQRLVALAARKRPSRRDFAMAGHADAALPASSRTR